MVCLVFLYGFNTGLRLLLRLVIFRYHPTPNHIYIAENPAYPAYPAYRPRQRNSLVLVLVLVDLSSLIGLRSQHALLKDYEWQESRWS